MGLIGVKGDPWFIVRGDRVDVDKEPLTDVGRNMDAAVDSLTRKFGLGSREVPAVEIFRCVFLVNGRLILPDGLVWDLSQCRAVWLVRGTVVIPPGEVIDLTSVSVRQERIA